jgi:membrane protease subunit HflC
VKWKIEDFSKYYLAPGGGKKIQAEDLLKRKINNGLRSEIGNRTIKDIVSGERSTVMEDALMKMARSSELGIKVVDVRIKQINLPVEVSSSIYQRMRAERTAVAREHRSQGREQAEILRADIDRKVGVAYGANAGAGYHKRFLYVIDPKGKISYVATPFNQMSADAYTDLGNAITQAGSSH